MNKQSRNIEENPKVPFISQQTNSLIMTDKPRECRLITHLMDYELRHVVLV